MTMYAIGRRLTFLDQQSLQKMSHELSKKGNGMQTLIQQIVTSDLFP